MVERSASVLAVFVGLSVLGAPLSAQGNVQPAPIRFVQQIGEELGTPERELGMVTGLAFLPGDKIAISDVTTSNVRIFTLSGEYLATLGRSGGGPGEFLHPGTIVVDSVIRVFDGMQNRVVIFALSGEHIETDRLPTAPRSNVTHVEQLSTGQVLASTSPAFAWGQPMHQTDVVVLHLHPDGAVDTLARYHQGPTVWYTVGRHAPWGLTFARFGAAGAWAVRDSTVALADGYAGIVRFVVGRADGSLVTRARVRLPGKSRPVVEADLAEVEESVRAADRNRPMGRLGFEPPPRWSIAQKAFFAGDGVLWVRQAVREDSSEVWTLVTPDGVQHSWAFPTGLQVRAVAAGYVAGVRKLESDVQVVMLYRLAER